MHCHTNADESNQNGRKEVFSFIDRGENWMREMGLYNVWCPFPHSVLCDILCILCCATQKSAPPWFRLTICKLSGLRVNRKSGNFSYKGKKLIYFWNARKLKDWKKKLLNSTWRSRNKEAACKKLIHCTNIVQLRNLCKFIHQISIDEEARRTKHKMWRKKMKSFNRNCWIKHCNTTVCSCLVLGALANLQVDNCTYINTLNIGWNAVDRHICIRQKCIQHSARMPFILLQTVKFV
jgi:hypothetical protein